MTDIWLGRAPTSSPLSPAPYPVLCASPPLDRPAEFADDRQINIEPINIDSCLQRYAISLFVDENEQIAAVYLDLWEP